MDLSNGKMTSLLYTKYMHHMHDFFESEGYNIYIFESTDISYFQVSENSFFFDTTIRFTTRSNISSKIFKHIVSMRVIYSYIERDFKFHGVEHYSEVNE